MDAEFVVVPDLEIKCPDCNGRGVGHEMGEQYPCHECGGAGYQPTESGKKILALVRHELRRRRLSSDDE